MTQKSSTNESGSASSVHIPLMGQVNFRDLGGFQTNDGRRTKSGLVYRSGELSFLSDDDIGIIAELGIKQIIDFRTDFELSLRGHDRDIEGAAHRRLPIEFGDLNSVIAKVFGEGDFNSIPANFLAEINRHILLEYTHVYADMLKSLTELTNLPLVFHCTHGKDRAGMGAAILLLALGVSKNDVISDYLASNVYRDADNEIKLAEQRAALANKQGVPLETIDISPLRVVYYVQASFFNDAFAAVLDHYGSFDKYLAQGLKLSDTDLACLRNTLLS